MICEPCTYLPGQEEGSLPISSSVTPLSVPSSGMPTPALFFESDEPKDGSPVCMCSRETSGCLIHPSGKAEWIASMQDSLARIFLLLEKARGSKENGAGSSRKSYVQLTLFAPPSSSSKTPRSSSPVDLTTFSGRLPNAGMMRGGWFWQLPMLGRPILGSVGGASRGVPTVTVADSRSSGGRAKSIENGSKAHAGTSLTDFVLLPTPTATNTKAVHQRGKDNGKTREPRRFVPTPRATDGAKGGPNNCGSKGDLALPAFAARFPTPTKSDGQGGAGCSGRSGGANLRTVVATPTARDWRSGRASRATMEKNSRPLSEQIGGQLNPTWVAWLMGWPLAWTRLSALAMDRCRSARRSRGKYSEANR